MDETKGVKRLAYGSGSGSVLPEPVSAKYTRDL